MKIIETPCDYKLKSFPADARLIAVMFNGEHLPRTSPTGEVNWEYSGGTVSIRNSQCTRLREATPSDPIKVEIRIIETL